MRAQKVYEFKRGQDVKASLGVGRRATFTKEDLEDLALKTAHEIDTYVHENRTHRDLRSHTMTGNAKTMNIMKYAMMSIQRLSRITNGDEILEGCEEIARRSGLDFNILKGIDDIEFRIYPAWR